MGRKRTHLKLTAEDRAAIAHQLKTTRDARERARLDFVVKAAAGIYTLQDLARLAGCSRSTIQNWMTKFERRGLRGLLKRDTPPGKHSPLASARIQTELRQGLISGRWTTAQQVADWLRERHNIKLARKSVYYWFRKIKPLGV